MLPGKATKMPSSVKIISDLRLFLYERMFHIIDEI